MTNKITATDKELGKLHAKVAQVMLKALESSDTAGLLLDEFMDELPEKVVDFLEKQVTVNPALLQAVTKFLKDNEVTCQIDEDESMSDLQKRLAEKRTRKSVGNVEYLDHE